MDKEKKSEIYYSVFDIVDRIGEEALRKYGTWSKFSKAMGYSRPWFYSMRENHFMRIETLLKMAKYLDLSVDYLLTGKNKAPFKAESFDVKNILKYSYKDKSLAVIKSQIKKGNRKDINITTLFSIAEDTGYSPLQILRGGK